MKRLQVTISDKRWEQLEALSAIRGVQPAVLLRLMAMDQINDQARKACSDNVNWRDTFLEIERRYSIR